MKKILTSLYLVVVVFGIQRTVFSADATPCQDAYDHLMTMRCAEEGVAADEIGIDAQLITRGEGLYCQLEGTSEFGRSSYRDEQLNGIRAGGSSLGVLIRDARVEMTEDLTSLTYNITPEEITEHLNTYEYLKILYRTSGGARLSEKRVCFTRFTIDGELEGSGAAGGGGAGEDGEGDEDGGGGGGGCPICECVAGELCACPPCTPGVEGIACSEAGFTPTVTDEGIRCNPAGDGPLVDETCGEGEVSMEVSDTDVTVCVPLDGGAGPAPPGTTTGSALFGNPVIPNNSDGLCQLNLNAPFEKSILGFFELVIGGVALVIFKRRAIQKTGGLK